MLVLVPGLLGAQQVERMRVNADGVNLRVAPSIDSSIVRALARGTVVTVLARDGAWVKVQAPSATGWVRGSQLVPIADVAKDTAVQSQSAAPAQRGVSGVPPAAAPAAAPAITAPMKGKRPTSGAHFSLGFLGSVTPVDGANGTAENHLAAQCLLELRLGAFGLYAAPQLGTGAGYRSTMLGGGLSFRLATAGRLELRALAGYTTYAEKATTAGISPPTTDWSSRGASFGGLVSVRLFGSVRMAYHGEYVMSFGDSSGLRFGRHSFGVLF
jgi:hypothetical protein